MKNLMPNKHQMLIIIGIFCLVMIAVPVIAWAQPGLPSDPQQSPLGGLSILAAIGGGYAVKKLRDKSK